MKTIFQKNRFSGVKITLFASVHGDELIGLKVCNILSKLDISRGSLQAIEANSMAVKKNTRFIDQDLNRSFKAEHKNSHEYKLSKLIKPIIKKSDVIIDIHGTNSKIDSLVIVTKWNKKIRNILKQIPINKIMYTRSNKFGDGSLIDIADIGLALEYGPNKNGASYMKCVNHIKQFLINQRIIAGRKKVFCDKELYTVYDTYKVPKDFEPLRSLREFKKIYKGECIGQINGKKVISSSTFYPIFLHKGSYTNTLSLMSYKQNVVLE